MRFLTILCALMCVWVSAQAQSPVLNDVQKNKGQMPANPTPATPRTGGTNQPSTPNIHAYPKNNAIDEEENKIPEDFEARKVFGDTYETFLGALKGGKKLSLKDAVFLVESAYYENRLSYLEYGMSIDSMKNLILHHCKTKPLKGASDYNNKSYWLYKFMQDTLRQYENGKLIYQHNPYQYDFSDFEGKKDWHKMFVTKLMKTGTGQCHSLPLLMKILADELGVKTYLSFLPKHCYIQWKDDQGRMYNYETTSKQFVSDAWLVESGFATKQAIQNRIYMDTLTHQQTLAYCLYDLIAGFDRKFGDSVFSRKALKEAQKFYPNNIHILCALADLKTNEVKFLARKYGKPPVSELPKYPELNQARQEMLAQYKHIDGLGYKEIPKEVYKKWVGESAAQGKEVDIFQKK
jgi:hypothetical protein